MTLWLILAVVVALALVIASVKLAQRCRQPAQPRTLDELPQLYDEPAEPGPRGIILGGGLILSHSMGGGGEPPVSNPLWPGMPWLPVG